MKNLVYLFIFFTILTFNSNAQDETKPDLKELPIFNTDSLKFGIYLNFNEFQNNSPSITDLNIIYVGKRSNLNEIYGIRRNTHNFFNKENSLTKVDSAWGFYDGTNVYVNINNLYYEMKIRGRFCLLSYTIITSGMETYHKTSEYILDTITGEIFRFNVKYLKKKILIYDNELLAKFKDESMKDVMTVKYLNDFNAKYLY